MNIQDLGGEFGLIENLTQDFSNFHSEVKKGIGDDCAVIDLGDKYQLISSDTLVANDHFNLNWSTPEQVGMKAVEVNVSDIFACGGIPKYILVSLVLTRDLDAEIIQGIYRGIQQKCEEYKIDLIGGDTTHGNELVINVTILGEVEKITNYELQITNNKNSLKLRSHAKIGDLICVTGDLGGSTAGLEYLRKFNDAQKLKQEFPYLYTRHLEPIARRDAINRVSTVANAMIDVSDGLASEVRHICEQSNCGAEVDFSKIPLHSETKLCAEKLGKIPEDWALSGGEDFELVFTIPEEAFRKDAINRVSTVIGKILPKDEGVWLLKNEKREELKGGYDHFKLQAVSYEL